MCHDSSVKVKLKGGCEAGLHLWSGTPLGCRLLTATEPLELNVIKR